MDIVYVNRVRIIVGHSKEALSTALSWINAVQLHFSEDAHEKPVEMIHKLKLYPDDSGGAISKKPVRSVTQSGTFREQLCSHDNPSQTVPVISAGILRFGQIAVFHSKLQPKTGCLMPEILISLLWKIPTIAPRLLDGTPPPPLALISNYCHDLKS